MVRIIVKIAVSTFQSFDRTPGQVKPAVTCNTDAVGHAKMGGKHSDTSEQVVQGWYSIGPQVRSNLQWTKVSGTVQTWRGGGTM
jgi:hypothetical protein